jgi:hypothetical protein
VAGHGFGEAGDVVSGRREVGAVGQHLGVHIDQWTAPRVGVVRPSTCSANVRTEQPVFSQKNLRTLSRINPGVPAIAASSKVGW